MRTRLKRESLDKNKNTRILFKVAHYSFTFALALRTKAQVSFSIFYDVNMSTKSKTYKEFSRVSFGEIM